MADSRLPDRLDSLTGLRFFAALGVVLVHSTILLDPRLLGWNLWSFGGLGVQFFFVLSGFVLTWTSRAEDTPGAFWRRRAARILPLYFGMLIIAEILLQVLPLPAGRFTTTWQFGSDHMVSLYSLTLIQGWIAPHSQLFLIPGAASPNPPGWSLSDETFFYALFPVIITLVAPLQRRGLLTLAAATFVFLVVGYFEASAASWLTLFPPYQLGFFVAGIATAIAVRQRLWFPPLWASLASMVVLAAGMYLASRNLLGITRNQPLYEMLVLPFMMVLFGSAARADLASLWSPLRHRWIVTLGVWSFALYLVQIPCFMVAICVFPNGLSANRVVATGEELAFLLFAVFVSAVAHYLIEKPANARLRHAPPPIILEQEHPATVT